MTRIAMGIPVGSDIEYTDEITMLKAMEGVANCSFRLQLSAIRHPQQCPDSNLCKVLILAACINSIWRTADRRITSMLFQQFN